MKREIFSIDPDIRRAETLSAEFYTDGDFFEESKEKIFARSWQLAGRVSLVDNLFPQTILKGFLDEPVLLTRENGELLCVSNVCTHRGNILVEKACRAGGIRCGYHGRQFSLDGKFLSMPEFEEAADFPTEKDDLPKIPLGIWRDFLFVSLNPRAPLERFIGEMKQKPFDFENLRFAGSKDYEVRAHWALYCENYLEGFHIPFIHQTLNKEIDYGSYTTELFRFSSLQTALASGVQRPGGRSGAFSENRAAYYFFIFPNLMFNFYEWGISVNIVKPLKKDLTGITYLTYVSDETKLEQGAGGDLETVESEDQAVVEAVQKGITSRFYQRGRYSPKREQGTHHFHRLIAEFMD